MCTRIQCVCYTDINLYFVLHVERINKWQKRYVQCSNAIYLLCQIIVNSLLLINLNTVPLPRSMGTKSAQRGQLHKELKCNYKTLRANVQCVKYTTITSKTRYLVFTRRHIQRYTSEADIRSNWSRQIPNKIYVF